MIERIIVPNLLRYPERRWANRGALIEMGVPNALIEYFPARDCHDFAGAPERAVAEAKREGWKMNENKATSYLNWHQMVMLKVFCTRWTFVLIFQKIMHIRSDGYFIFMVDDSRFIQPYDIIVGIVDYAISHGDALGVSPSIIQLHPWETPNEPFVNRTPIDTEHPIGRLVAHGLRGSGDAALIINRHGAQILYERMCITGGSHSLEGQLWLMAQEPDQSGFYSVLNPQLLGGIHIPSTIMEFDGPDDDKQDL